VNPIDGPCVTSQDGEEPGWFDANTHKRIYCQDVLCLDCGDEASRDEVLEAGGHWGCTCGKTQVLA
jgi:hypothetical protein